VLHHSLWVIIPRNDLQLVCKLCPIVELSSIHAQFGEAGGRSKGKDVIEDFVVSEPGTSKRSTFTCFILSQGKRKWDHNLTFASLGGSNTHISLGEGPGRMLRSWPSQSNHSPERAS
jgi:hypothetical protein